MTSGFGPGGCQERTLSGAALGCVVALLLELLLTPNTDELISALGALSPPRQDRPGPGPHTLLLEVLRDPIGARIQIHVLPMRTNLKQ